MKWPSVSIIVPYPKDNPYLRECLEHCLRLDYPDYEIILLPDGPEKHDLPQNSGPNELRTTSYELQIKVVPTGKIGPSQKRDIGLSHARGEIVAFLDDDTYPVREWLKNAVRHFADPEIAAVGGPAVTPPSDGEREQASGAIYASPLVSGQYVYRYLSRTKRYVDDYPSCNLLVRRDVMREIGGYDSTFYPGEDTVICLKITRDLKKKILYDPEAQVFHHRRKVFRGHLRQIKNYALHRGYFVRKFPETSLRLSYFIPTLFTVGVAIGWAAAWVSPFFLSLYCGLLGVYLAATFFAAIRPGHVKISLLVFGGIIATHFTYGFWFLVGLFSKAMREEKLSVSPSQMDPVLRRFP